MNEPRPRRARALSFRDPSGYVVRAGDRVLRIVAEHARPAMAALLESKFTAAAVAAGDLVAARLLPAAEAAELGLGLGDGAMVVEHQRIAFPSYPYEWPAEMLHAAGRLTLTLAQAAIGNGLGLKDATPSNVLFAGPRAVFVDWPSLEQREPRDPTWLADAQLQRTFLLPLLAYRAFGVEPSQVFLTQRDGLSPRQVYRMCGRVRRLLPPFLALATLPTWLERPAEGHSELYRPRLLSEPRQARFVVTRTLARRARQLERLEPPRRDSTWSGYMAAQPSHYGGARFAAKEDFVREILERHRPRRVLDVGCNTGHFARLAARSGASVVAIDTDSAVVGELWRSARAAAEDVLPLVVDLARPTPAVGWDNGEGASFLDRARGQFDAVLLLAVLHHFLVTERVPLDRLMALVASLTRKLAVVEFVGRDDPMFRRIARGRDVLHADLDVARFEAAGRPHFEILRSMTLEGSDRTLYALRKRDDAPAGRAVEA